MALLALIGLVAIIIGIFHAPGIIAFILLGIVIHPYLGSFGVIIVVIGGLAYLASREE